MPARTFAASTWLVIAVRVVLGGLVLAQASGCGTEPTAGSPQGTDAQSSIPRGPRADAGADDAATRSDSDAGPAIDIGSDPVYRGTEADVASVNDLGADGAAGRDASCAAATSCAFEFNYPRGSESSVELFGDFNAWNQGVAMELTASGWRVRVPLTSGATVLYKFVLDGSSWVADPANPEHSSDGFDNSIARVSCPPQCKASSDGGAPADATSADGGGFASQSFDWHDGIMYFVMLDRFFDGDSSNNHPEPGVETPANFQGGDLAGLLAKLRQGYFQNLGVNVLWLSSIVDTPGGAYPGSDGHSYTGYHGYWPGELDQVEEHLGTLDDLKAVVDEAHRQGIRVLLDYVMNHVHQQSSTYRDHPDWFWPIDDNGRNCVCGQDCSWDTVPDRLRCWFDTFLPDFDFQIDDARAFSVGNAVDWAKKTGIDGFRLDAVKHIEPSWLTDLRARVSAEVTRPGQTFYLIGETYTADQSLISQFIDPATKLNGQFDFPLRAQLLRTILMRQGSFYDLEGYLNASDGIYGRSAVMGSFLGNHDLPRAIHLAEDVPEFGEWDGGKDRAWTNQPAQPDYERPYQRMAVGFTALFTLGGIPLVYYGDENGMAGAGDPDNRRMMQFDPGNAYQQALREHLARVAKLRQSEPTLRHGSRQQLWVAQDVYAYQLTYGAERVVVVLNRGDSDQEILLPAAAYTDLLTGATVDAAHVSIGPRSSLILK